MKEDIKLHILLGHWIFLRGSGIVGAGGKWFPYKLSKGSAPNHRKLQGGKTDIMSHRCTHRNAMDMGVGAYERGHPITYSGRRLNFFKGFWCS